MSPAPRPSLDAGLVRHTGRSYWQALTRAAEAAAAVHVAFSVLFFALGAPVLGAANVGSVVVYALIRSLLLRRRNRTALVLLWLELLLHALVATRVLGWDSGFHYYLLLMMPLVFVSPTRTLRSKLLLGGTLAAFYIGLDAYAHQRAPLSEIAPGALHALRYFNIATTMALLAYLAHAYFGAVMRAERRLHDLATTDALTGLANRRRMLQAADQHLGRRRNDGTPLSFILGDVDHFKSVNDRHGHDVGDRVLVKVARAMKQATREADLVGRWGGEEFLIVLPETGLDEALHVAERVREAVRHGAAGQDEQDLHVTITLGVSSLREGESLASAISRADAAMYRGKLGGRNRSVAEEPDMPAAEAAGRPLAAANG